jgi:hypothetical protein
MIACPQSSQYPPLRRAGPSRIKEVKVRQILAKIPGSLADDIISERNERWKIEQTAALDKITLVELREPVSAGFDSDQSEKWVMIWARGAALLSIY